MSAGPPLELTVSSRAVDEAEVVVVKAVGEVDLATADSIAAALGSPECAAAGGVVLELSEVGFIDSSGLRVVLVAVRDMGSKLAVVCTPEGPVARLFALAEVTGRIPAFADETAAIAALRAGASNE